jgi:asparagine synthase (glutamine-hydrolysing)/putative beta-lactam synthetase
LSALAGWVDFGRELAGERAAVTAMTASMRHRGPAHMEVWCGGHAALGFCAPAGATRSASVVPDASGRARDPAAIMLDGHVTNLAELAGELEAAGAILPTRTPAEILLGAYARWGEKFVEHLHGAFALALWNEATRELLLARDRIGLKPLYWYAYPTGLLFGSEPKAIMANPRFAPRLDLAKLPILLQPRLTEGGETQLLGLNQVRPAHVLQHRAGVLTQRRYWALESAPHRDDFETTAARLRALLADSVAGETAGETRCGAMLSGGIDSSSVVALAAQPLPGGVEPVSVDSYCIRLSGDGNNFASTELRPDIDAPFAAQAAAHFRIPHHELAVSTEALLAAIPATRRARDLPGWGQFDASMYILFGEMSRRSGVGLSGEAADEFLGGYPYLFKRETLTCSGFPWLGNGLKLADFLSDEARRHVDPDEDERARHARLFAEIPRLDGEDPHNARMREILFFGMAGPLAVVLDRKERMSAAWGLDIRIPFCDHRLVQYLWNVPWSMKCRGGVKGLLKAAMADLLPASTLERKKSAYPHVQSSVHDHALIAEASRIAADERDPVRGLFAAGALDRLIATLESGSGGKEFPGGASPAYMLIHVVELSRWLAEYRVSV